MALLKVLHYPDPRLKEKARVVEDFGPKAQKIFDDMIETMYVEDGVGLAAPQVGISQRILIASPTATPGEEIVIANPVIIETWGRESATEGCLSLPGVSGDVIRAKKIRFKFHDRDGREHDLEVRDLFARIILHELDHLDGILLLDRVDFNQRQELLERYQAL